MGLYAWHTLRGRVAGHGSGSKSRINLADASVAVLLFLPLLTAAAKLILF